MSKSNNVTSTLETMEVRIRMLTFIKDVIKDNTNSIDYAQKQIDEYNEREKNGEELDRWDRQSRLDYGYDILARQQMNELLVSLTK